MTVKELVEKLQTFPQDAVVLYRAWSELNAMDDDDVWLAKPEEKLVVRRNGMYMGYHHHHWPKEETPEFVEAVCFPGN